ncbi:LEAF RUST 10 DISEASE-RESISTANCE LOCUS RECEPTOR-LIKE PROTEIN KINASE-like 1.1 isoform X3 [Ziziphus jujuba]|uniref:non-specific serine/threonine protein kinase n=1 Tax=Ziziphus jujuba TaxID=326968 RepID=A0ABM3ZXX1_ZIZJJ|nr:LEAF RUST 10 DISEASE-RESISTANCE LOCUS RECEPTOR-LIKE PROTEIN KINASE-like 1.1 isoform X3 [Ziziphus jujuba]
MVNSPSCFLFLAFVFAAVTNLSTTTTALKFQRVTDEERFKECNQEFTCESTRSQLRFKYPFWGGGDEMSHCGLTGFKLTCRENYAVIEIMKENFTILEIKWDEQIVTVVRMDMLDDGCPDYEFINITVYNKTFECAPSNEKLTYSYGCSSSNISSRKVPQEKGFTCTPNETVPGLYTMETPHQTNKISCTNTTDIPVLPKYYRYLQSNKMAAKDVVKEGFDLRYKFDTKEACSECLRSGGQCGCNEVSKEFVCFYEGDGGSRKWKLGLGIGVGFLGLFLIAIFIICCYKKRRASSNIFSRSTTDPYLNTDVEGGSCYFGVPVFPFNDLAKATNNFASEKELGDGGFGSVYHGKLKDGREVAVKRLYEHNYKRVEQFMNEIEILTRLRHRNLVSLYGCTSRHSRELLLVYEYIPNGTVADHLHGEQAKPGLLPWSIRMSIAIETATALAYLHASEIVHRDVKTNNILLDNNFTVKVADFGLSRLFPNDVTHVSTAPQGTPGYVDPEYHQCYQLTSKSDVYSFGVVLIELISSLPAVDITRHRHEINLANLATSKIQKCEFHELIDPSTGFETDSEVRRMTIAVAELAFQCLQQNKEMRPSMEEVLETLKSIESREDSPDENQEKEFDDIRIIKSEQPPPPSPECDEVGLLKNMRPPASPISVTHKWPSTRSITPNVSG